MFGLKVFILFFSISFFFFRSPVHFILCIVFAAGRSIYALAFSFFILFLLLFSDAMHLFNECICTRLNDVATHWRRMNRTKNKPQKPTASEQWQSWLIKIVKPTNIKSKTYYRDRKNIYRKQNEKHVLCINSITVFCILFSVFCILY